MIQAPFSEFGKSATKIRSASGHYLAMSDGTIMYDCQAGGSANMLGHNLSELCHIKSLNYCSDWDLEGPAWEEFERAINRVLGNKFETFIPQLTGSDAVDTAIRCAWGNTGGKIIVRPNSYHSGSITGWQLSDREKQFTSSWQNCNWFVEAENDYDPHAIEKLLRRGGISGILVDALTWSNELRFMIPKYWHRIYGLSREYGVPLIVDEVLTGCGKLGAWSYFVNTLKIVPDMLILGKNLTAGHDQLAVVCVTPEFSEKIKGTWLASGNTKSFNECGAAVATRHIEFVEDNDSFDSVTSKIAPYLNELCLDINSTGKANAISFGCILSIDCKSDIAGLKFHLKMKKLGYWQRLWKKSYFHIFYNVTDEELDNLKEAILKSL